MSVDCQISFDNPDGVYYSGEDLSGAVIMTIMGEYKVRSKLIIFFILSEFPNFSAMEINASSSE